MHEKPYKSLADQNQSVAGNRFPVWLELLVIVSIVGVLAVLYATTRTGTYLHLTP